MEEYVKIETPEQALLFVSANQFADFCKDFERLDKSTVIQGEPDKYPCIGFPVHTVYNMDRKDVSVYAFVYLISLD